MKIHDLNCLLGKISCTLNSAKSEISSDSLNTDIDLLISEIQSFSESIPSNEDVDKDIDSILFVLDIEIGALIDSAVDAIEDNTLDSDTPKALDDIRAKSDLNENTISHTSFDNHSELGSSDFQEKKFTTPKIKEPANKSEISFTSQGIFGGSKACHASDHMVEIIISHKYLWQSINKRLSEMSYRKIPYDSVNLGVFNLFLSKFYSLDKSVNELISLFVDMGEYSKSEVEGSFKGDSIKLSIFSRIDKISSDHSLFEKRYNHKTSFISVQDEVSLLQDGDSKLSAILGF